VSDEGRVARQAINLDHERRLLWLEERMSVLEREVAGLKPHVNEILIAQRVTAGVKRALAEDSTIGLNRWQRVGIAAGVLSGVGAFVLSIAQSIGHG
jgi:hypothetical protein